MKKDIENKVAITVTSMGVFLLAFGMVAREGVEIAILTFAGSFCIRGILTGLVISLMQVILTFELLVKVNLKVIFNITLAYLILQASLLQGYAIHEGLSAFKDIGYIAGTNPIYTKLFDLSNTVLNYKEGWLGIPLYVGLG